MQRVGSECSSFNFTSWQGPIESTVGDENADAGQTIEIYGACCDNKKSDIWINEFHYDNTSDDVGESMEIAYIGSLDLCDDQFP